MSPAPPPSLRTLGIVGAGRVGLAIARRAVAAGLDVGVAARRPPEEMRAVIEAGAPGASSISVADAARRDAVLLALPLGKIASLDAALFAGALVIDASNHWWEIDGRLPQFEDLTTSTSEQVGRHLAGARIVKSLNHVGAYVLEELHAPPGDPARIAVAVAGDGADDVDAVAGLVDALGYDPVVAGSLAEGMRFEPGTELFGAEGDAAEARAMLDRFWDSQRGRVVARARAAL
ncbi:NADPH-dependent F420 reductase [Demequina sp. NBRC 110056]|uniref:NADPH-dependent F420 reductase n=1 Tax=Demequina sp. NBRC 110056 TaxID=1570345 RepID=UPI0009FDE07A|nr:NAD(P)-binding domain-containing protein [Demequina sp. NBRC 110056]